MNALQASGPAVRRDHRFAGATLTLLAVLTTVAVGVGWWSDTAAVSSSATDHSAAAIGAADGVVADGTTLADDTVPALAKLDPDLLAALRSAAADAGIDFPINSGWRSRALQEQLFHDAVTQYGSAAEAARWVADPDTSAHVTGDAVDVGSYAASTWLARHGAAYGLCQIYGNEAWHFELRPDAATQGCPVPLADARQRARS